MRYTHLGRTGLRVSRICLGTMNFGPETDEPTSFSIMDSALEAGINFFDTANVYGRSKGRGATEEIVGRWFARGGERRENENDGYDNGIYFDGPPEEVMASKDPYLRRFLV